MIHTISSLEVEEVSCGASVTCGVAVIWLELPALAAAALLFEADFPLLPAFVPEELLFSVSAFCVCVP